MKPDYTKKKGGINNFHSEIASTAQETTHRIVCEMWNFEVEKLK